MSDPNPSTIADALQPLLDEAEALRSDVHAAENARKLSARYNLGMLGLVAVGLVAVLAIGYQNNKLGHQVAQANATLADCTVPGGVCYQEGQARTGKAIQDVLRAEIAVSECARLFPGESGTAYDKKIEACVYARLAQSAAPATPTPTPSASPR